MKKIVSILIFSLFCVCAFGQKPVSEAQKNEMITKISSAAAALQSMQCDFTQTKTLSMLNDKLISKGVMFYRAGKLLRWEYKTPYTYIFIINGNQVLTQSAKNKNVIDVKSSRLFQEITQIMMNSVTGSSLSNTSDFAVQMFAADKEWIAVLTPQKKGMKQMFLTIKLYFDVSKSMVSKVEMCEKSGDVTLIELKNIQTNRQIDEKVFSVN